jgi:hypothetical protein
MPGDFESFAEFWPFYVAQHTNAANRAAHFVGTTLALVCLAGALISSPQWLLVALVPGYGCAWAGHLLFERNRPATLRHPLWSMRGDFRMYRLILAGRMHRELEVAARSWTATGEPAEAAKV